MTNRWKVYAGVALAVLFGAGTVPSGATGRPVEITERLKGAERVVVASASGVRAAWRQNSHGDRLIVSQVQLRVEETLKGAPAASAWVEVEGGALDGITLRVSDIPELKAGDRAVFLLDGSNAVQVPHQRGLGILMLDAENRVVGTSLTLDEIRRAARAAQ